MGDRDPLADIPALDSCVESLLRLTREVFDSPIHYSDDDHLAFMALTFVSKQAEHLISVRVLAEKKQGRDATLIARSMIEGLALLLWAGLDSPARPLLWRSYAWIEDWRLMREKERAGETVDAAQKASILAQVQILGRQFMTKEALKAERNGAPLPSDPYRPTWHGRTLRNIFDEVHRSPLYQHIYRGTSNWTHWAPRGVGIAIRREGDHTRYTSDTHAWTATALAAGFQALLESLRLLDSHLQLGYAARISQVEQDCLRQVGTVASPP